MSATEETTEMAPPCVLVTSCDSEYKEEELIKRKLLILIRANMLMLNKANLLLV